MRSTTTRPTIPTWRATACAVAIGLAAVTGSVQAQQATTPGSPALTPPPTLGVAEVAVQVEQVAAALRDLEARAAPPPDVLEIERRLDTEGQAFRQNLGATQVVLAGQPTLEDLREMERVWAERAKRLGTWSATLARRGRSLEEQVARAEALEAEWKGIGAGLGDAPEQLRQRVAGLIEEIGATERRLDERRDAELLSASRVAQLAVEAGELLTAIRRAQGATFGRLLIRESQPLWRALAAADNEPPLGQGLRDAFAAEVEQTRAWIRERSEDLSGAIVLFVAVLGSTFLLRRRIQRLAGADQELQTAVMLRRPISVAFVIWLFLTPFPYVGVLPGLRAVLAMALTVALLRLLPRLLPSQRGLALYALLAFVTFDGLRAFTEPLILVDRLLFSAEVAGGIALLWWGRGWAVPRGGEPSAAARAFRATLPIALTALGIALLADVLGYMGLARLLGDGVIRSAYVTAVIYVLGRILDELVVVLLRAGFLHSLRVVRKRVAPRERVVRRIVSLAVTLVWALVVLRVMGLLDPVWGALTAILTSRLTFGEFSLSLGDVLAFALTIWASFLLSGAVRAVLDDEVLPRLTLRRGVPYAVSTIAGYAVLMFGFFAAVAAAGVPFGRLAIVIGGLGVGIGFGLQNIVNNFVSGTILLFERPIQIGDMIQMAALQGRVKRIGLRSSTIESPDGAEVIVPNADLISAQLVNWTLSDRRRRIDLPVGVAYGADPERVLALLVDAAREHRGVLGDPPPSALFLGFGQSSLDFSLRAWTDEDQDFPRVRSEIAVAVYRALTDADIEIPFPQQDLHVKSVAADVLGLVKPTGEDETPATAPPRADRKGTREDDVHPSRVLPQVLRPGAEERMQANRSPDIARTTFQLLALGILIASSFWIVRPFLVALTWAAMIVVATWPLLLHAQAWLGGRRSLAVASMTIALLLILVVPLYLGIETIVENANRIADWSKSLTTHAVPPPPGWVEAVPLVGAKIAGRWRQLAAAGPEEVAARISPYASAFAVWFVSQVGSIGLLLLQFLLTVIIAAILYANGEAAARGADHFARRLAGPQGENAVHLAGQAIRGVALGVVVTAILQSAAAGIGLAIVGVPFPAILTAVIFMLCVAQVGPGLVLIPAVIWIYSTRGAVWGTGFLVWAIFCGTFDNFVRPMLIRRGADLPLLLIFAGVIGGLIAFGVIGLFIGPVVLAVAYTLLVDWVSQDTPSDEPGRPTAAMRE